MRRIESEDQEERDQKIKAQQQVQGYIRNFLQEQQQLKQQKSQQQQEEDDRYDLSASVRQVCEQAAQNEVQFYHCIRRFVCSCNALPFARKFMSKLMCTTDCHELHERYLRPVARVKGAVACLAWVDMVKKGGDIVSFFFQCQQNIQSTWWSHHQSSGTDGCRILQYQKMKRDREDAEAQKMAGRREASDRYTSHTQKDCQAFLYHLFLMNTSESWSFALICKAVVCAP